MSVSSGLEAILLLLYTPGGSGRVGEEIRGITRVDKMLYLLLEEEKIWGQISEDLDFEPYEYGPFSNRLYDYVETLRDSGLVLTKEIEPTQLEEDLDAIILELEASETLVIKERKGMEVFSLSETGRRVGKRLFDSLSPEEHEALKRVKGRFNNVPLRQLLEHVYTRFPNSATKSLIREKILGESSFGRRPELKAFVREEEDFRD